MCHSPKRLSYVGVRVKLCVCGCVRVKVCVCVFKECGACSFLFFSLCVVIESEAYSGEDTNSPKKERGEKGFPRPFLARNVVSPSLRILTSGSPSSSTSSFV